MPVLALDQGRGRIDLSKLIEEVAQTLVMAQSLVESSDFFLLDGLTTELVANLVGDHEILKIEQRDNQVIIICRHDVWIHHSKQGNEIVITAKKGEETLYENYVQYVMTSYLSLLMITEPA